MSNIRRPAIISDRATKRRRKKRIFWSSLFLITTVLIVACVIWFSQASFLIIKKVDVEGAGESLEKNITVLVESKLEENLLWFLPRRNILFFNKNSVEEEIFETYTGVKDVKIKKKGLSKLKIIVEERKPVAIWCDSGIIDIGKCYFVDSSGYIFRKAPFFSDHVYFELYGDPLVLEKDISIDNMSSATTSSTTDIFKEEDSTKVHDFLGVQYLPEETFMSTMLFTKALEEEGIPTYAMVIKDENLFELYLGDGGVLKFSPTQDLIKALQDFKIAYKEKFKDEKDEKPSDVEYIDIRFTNKVVFKFVE